jgi:ribosomal protein L21E
MIDKFADGYVCGQNIHDVYAKIEKDVMPFLSKKSRRLSSSIPTIDYDDALQEGRVAIVVALAHYDHERGEDCVGPYVWKVVKNAYFGMAYEALMKSKMPHIFVTGTDGKVYNKPCSPISLNMLMDNERGGGGGYKQICGLIDTKMLSPECETMNHRVRSGVGKFTMKMYNKLGGIDRKVFKCKVHPSNDFLSMLYSDGVDFVHKDEQGVLVLADDFNITFDQIAAFLGINKNAVGWSLYKIRELFLEMAKYDDDFNELFDDLVIDKRWPSVWMVTGKVEDLEFEQKTFRKRHLDPERTSSDEYAASSTVKDANGLPFYSRLIKWYKWGSVIVIKRGDVYYTIIAEGRFNPLTGAVFGLKITGAHECIPLSWYKIMVKALNNE